MSAKVVEGDISNVSKMGTEIGEYIILIFLVLIAYVFIVYLRSIINTKLNYDRYRLVAEQSQSIIFEYNYGKNTAIHNGKWLKGLGYEPPEKDYIKSMTEGEIVAPEDVEKFESVFEELRQGEENISKEIRILDSQKKPIWYNMKASAIKNRKGKIEKIIGRYINIDREKREVEYFKEQAQSDLATGLYNKDTISYKISKTLSRLRKGDQCALLFIDIDDFKLVNDTYGHAFGDSLLEVLAIKIQEKLGENEFAGRVGGDEFALLMTSVQDEQEALSYAEQLSKSLTEVSFEEHPETCLSVSIGIAIAPGHGSDARTLLENADQAMYRAKEQGKKCSVLNGVTGYVN